MYFGPAVLSSSALSACSARSVLQTVGNDVCSRHTLKIEVLPKRIGESSTQQVKFMTMIRVWLEQTEIDMLKELKEFFDKQENADFDDEPSLSVRIRGRTRRIQRKITNNFVIRKAILTLYYETLSFSKEVDRERLMTKARNRD